MYMSIDNFNAVGSAAELQWREMIKLAKKMCTVLPDSTCIVIIRRKTKISFIMKMVEVVSKSLSIIKAEAQTDFYSKNKKDTYFV